MYPCTDEQLAAYADGELGAAEAAAIADAARADPELAQRLARFVETRRVLRETFADTLGQPVPRRLLEVLEEQPAARVVALRRRWMPLALAASVLAGVGAVLVTVRTSAPPPLTLAGLPPDAGALARVLERTRSGVPVTVDAGGARYEVLPLASLQTASGQYCREFESSAAGASAPARAAACREADGAWTILAAAPRPAPDGGSQEFRPAGASAPDPAAVLGKVRRLTPAEEDALLAAGWQSR